MPQLLFDKKAAYSGFLGIPFAYLQPYSTGHNFNIQPPSSSFFDSENIMLTKQTYAYVECLHLSFVSQLFYFFFF